MTKSEFLIEVLRYARVNEKVKEAFEVRDKDPNVTLRAIGVKHDRSEGNDHIFRIGADYEILKDGFHAKEDLIVEVVWNMKSKKFTDAKYRSVDEIDL